MYYSSIFFYVNRNFIRKYKIKLKTIVKNSNNLDLIIMLKKINFEISIWIKFYSFSYQMLDISTELDLYIYKVLWRFVKRCHPRRTSSWVYYKYWKNFSGIWKFTVYDFLKGKFYFLSSHKKLKKNFFYLPLSLNVFDSYNSKKLNSSVYKKYQSSFISFYLFIYNRQKGLCFCCKKTLNFKTFKLVNISNFMNKKVNFISNLYLFHSYCN